ncbi:MAG: putative two-component system response regulator [Candidatus Angelobacter sp.]|jgi:two-component system NarL family response regulator|nr:putative two-component system response regulator [Candidatus Angelobacter sp.]
MPAGKLNGQKTIGSGKSTRGAAIAGTRIQKLLEKQRPLDGEKKPIHELKSAQDSRNVFLQSDSREGADTVQEAAEPETPERKVLTVLIADDHPVVREGLAAIIQLQPDMRVIAEASNGQEAMEKFFLHHPDIVLLDLRMPLMDGVATVVAICEKQPGARLAILTSFESEEEIYRALRAGAQGYVLKDAPAADLIACIRAMNQGGTWIPPGVGAKLAKRVTGQELTTREMEVLRTLVLGKSNKEIGVALDIAESTVKVHVTHVLEKLKASGRTEAISVALKRGLIRMDPAQG